MGSANVRAVFASWSFLDDKAFRLLAFMALITMDDDADMLYWGGREMLCAALGRMTPAAPAEADSSARAESARATREADFQAVKRGIRQLVKSGAVVLHKGEAIGRPAVYKLCLSASTGLQRGSLSDPWRGSLGDHRSTDGGHSVTPVVGGVGGGDLTNQSTTTQKPKPISPLVVTSPVLSTDDAEEMPISIPVDFRSRVKKAKGETA